MARNTRTGRVLEQMILPSLGHGGYDFVEQVNIGSRPAGRKHIVDVVANKAGEKFLISLKNQEVGGTAEEKVPWEVICLIHAIQNSSEQFKKAYIVL